MNFKSLFKDEKGAILPMVAVLLGFVFLSFAAIVVDVGMLYSERRQMVTAADAGALAGAQVLEESEGSDIADAKVAAVEYAVKNGADPTKVNVAVETKSIQLKNETDFRQVITVNVGVTKELFFAKIFGTNTSDVAARAVATWGYVQKVAGGGILPLFATDTLYNATTGDKYLHWDKLIVTIDDVSESTGGNWGFIDVFPNTAAIKAAMEGQLSEVNLELSTILDNEQGNMTAAVDSIDVRMTAAKGLSNTTDRKKYMSGLIPVIDESGINLHGSNLELPILYFAVYRIEDYITQVKKIDGVDYSIGSSNALSFDDDYIEKTATPMLYGADSNGNVMPKNTIIGQFTGVTVPVDPISVIGDQIKPGEGEPIVTYHKLIE